MNSIEFAVEPLTEAEERETDGGLLIPPLGPTLLVLAFLKMLAG